MGDNRCNVGTKGLAEGARAAAWSPALPWAPPISLPPLDNLQQNMLSMLTSCAPSWRSSTLSSQQVCCCKRFQLTLASLTLCSVPLDRHCVCDVAELMPAQCWHVNRSLIGFCRVSCDPYLFSFCQPSFRLYQRHLYADCHHSEVTTATYISFAFY